MAQSNIAHLPRPSSPISDLPYEQQMTMLRTDIAFIHRSEGPLRKLHPFARAHFFHRLIDARAKQSA